MSGTAIISARTRSPSIVSPIAANTGSEPAKSDGDAVAFEPVVLVEDGLDGLDPLGVLLRTREAHQDQRPIALDGAQRCR